MIGSPECGCGKTLHPPYCDGSHARNQQQYKDWILKCEAEQHPKTTNTLEQTLTVCEQTSYTIKN